MIKSVLFIAKQLLAFSTAFSLFVSTSGVPLAYRFCGADVEMIRLALTASANICSELCDVTETDNTQATKTQEPQKHTCCSGQYSEHKLSQSSCCQSGEYSVQPASDETAAHHIADSVQDSAPSHDTSSPLCCHEELHVSQLEVAAVTVAVQPTFSPLNVVAVLPIAMLLHSAHFPQHTLFDTLAGVPPPKQDIPIFTGALLI